MLQAFQQRISAPQPLQNCVRRHSTDFFPYLSDLFFYGGALRGNKACRLRVGVLRLSRQLLKFKGSGGFIQCFPFSAAFFIQLSYPLQIGFQSGRIKIRTVFYGVPHQLFTLLRDAFQPYAVALLHFARPFQRIHIRKGFRRIFFHLRIQPFQRVGKTLDELVNLQNFFNQRLIFAAAQPPAKLRKQRWVLSSVFLLQHPFRHLKL